MARKDISDYLVVKAHHIRNNLPGRPFPYELLHQWTEEPIKVCYKAMERAYKRGLLEYGVSLRTAWLTDKGLSVLKGR